MENSQQNIVQAIQFIDKPLHTQRLPRYTSYPPATEFSSLSAETHHQWLTTLPKEQAISLYIHIPYCQQLCWFCGCFTSITQHYEPIQRYVELLLKEIQWAQKTTGPLTINHLHFGGGSPTALSPIDFIKIMHALKDGFDFKPNAEIAVEMDPRTVDQSKIAAYAESGVNRASLGVQDFDSKVQKAIHREQSYERVAEVTQQLREHKIDKINFDLMYGLPYQTVESVTRTVAQALTLEPERLSVFGYAHVPWMRKHQQVLSDLPMADPDTRIAMFSAMKQVFLNHEYVAIGIDHYAKQNDSMVHAMQNEKLKRNFQGYTTDQAETVLAFGLSAISSLPQGYAQNTTQSKEYKSTLTQNISPVNRGLPISVEDKLRRDIISELMCHYKVDLECLALQHNLEINFANELEALLPFIETQLLEVTGKQLVVTPAGQTYVRSICAVFDQYLKQDTNKFSLAI